MHWARHVEPHSSLQKVLLYVTWTDRENYSPISCTVNTWKMLLKAKKTWRGKCKICTLTYPQPSITHWHTGHSLSHLYNASAKRSCGSSQGCDLISELSAFVLELQPYAHKQVHNVFGLGLEGEKFLQNKERNQSVVIGRRSSRKCCNCVLQYHRVTQLLSS